MSKPIQMEKGVKYRDADKMALIPVKNMPTEQKEVLRKPEWMRIKLPADSQRIQDIKSAMRKNNLHSVCEEASCPNLAECFNHGTATFMILGAICTRRCHSATLLMAVHSLQKLTNHKSSLKQSKI